MAPTVDRAFESSPPTTFGLNRTKGSSVVLPFISVRGSRTSNRSVAAAARPVLRAMGVSSRCGSRGSRSASVADSMEGEDVLSNALSGELPFVVLLSVPQLLGMVHPRNPKFC